MYRELRRIVRIEIEIILVMIRGADDAVCRDVSQVCFEYGAPLAHVGMVGIISFVLDR